MPKISSLYLFSSLLLSNALMAGDLQPMIQIGYDFGGTTLATVERYDNYNGYELKNDPSLITKGDSIGINLSYRFGEYSKFRQKERA